MATFVGILMELFRMFLTFTRPYSDKMLDILYKLFMGKPQPLPPIEDKIILLSATELASRIRKRKLKAEVLMAAYIERIKAVDQLINACTDYRFDDAMQDAKEVDIFLERTDRSEEELARDTPLLGVPFTCKEAIGVKGMLVTRGIVAYKDHKAQSDGETTSLYRKAGAIPLTVTNVPLNLMWWESANQIFGMTKNPYDHRRTVGGSSGGEGAIITAGAAVIGIGNDLAGSIRIPSSFCGIYGHKPSVGVISNATPWPRGKDVNMNFLRYVSTGPMCRYVQDLTLLTEVLAGNTDKVNFRKRVDFRFVNVFYIEEFPGFLLKATPDVKAAVRKAVKHFEQKFGITGTKLSLKELQDAFTIWECKLLESEIPSFKDMIAEGKTLNLRTEFLKSLVCCSEFTWPALYFAAVDRRTKDDTYFHCLNKFKILREKMDCLFRDDAILLLPTHPEPPPHYLLTIPKYPNIAYTCIFNILGYPSSQIPAGLSHGLPIGIQAVSSTFKDHLTLAAAVELDKVFGGWISPCPVAV